MVARALKFGRFSTAAALLAVALLGSLSFLVGFTAAPALTFGVAVAGGVAGAVAVATSFI